MSKFSLTARVGKFAPAIFLAMLCAGDLMASSARVAVVGVNVPPAWNQDVQHKLMSTNLFGVVDVISVTTPVTSQTPIPTLDQLRSYDGILFYAWSGLGSADDANALGDRIADYLDAGGKVLDMVGTNDQASPLGGRFRTGGYALMMSGPTLSGTPLRLGSFVNNPLVSNLEPFEGGSSSFFTNGALTPDADAVAFWDNNVPLMILQRAPKHNRATLNFFPVSSDVRADFWNAEVPPFTPSTPTGAFAMGATLISLLDPPPSSTCSFTVAPGSASVAQIGLSYIILVTASDPRCAWSATSADPWIHLSDDAVQNRSGTTNLFYGVDANPGPARTGTLRVAGHDFLVQQQGNNGGPNAADFTLIPTALIARHNQVISTNVSVITATPDLSWTASTDVPWIHIDTQLPKTGSGFLDYLVDANPGLQRTGTLTVAGLTYTVRQGGPACFFTITSQSNSASSGSVAFSASSPSCPWTAESNSPGITLTSADSGVGSGLVSFSLASNTSGVPRTLSLTVAMQTALVNQDSVAPVFTLDPTSRLSPFDAGAGSVGVTAIPSDAPWTAVSNVPWMHIAGPSSKIGNDAIEYSIDQNPSQSDRVGTMTIAGKTFTVTQVGAVCNTDPSRPVTFFVRVSSQSFASTGGGGVVEVFTPDFCSWTASSNADWIPLSGGGTGSGSRGFTVAANAGVARSATLTIAGQMFTVTQAASGGNPNATTMILPQFVFGGGWYTALYFTMTGSGDASFPINFIANDGTPLNVPSIGGASTVVNIPALGTAVVEAPNSGPFAQGYASIALPVGVTGYAVFRQSVSGRPDQEAVVPLSGASTTASRLIWDETNFTTAVSVVGLSSQPSTVHVAAWDEAGTLIGIGEVVVPANGKQALILREVPGLEGMVGKRGSADFRTFTGSAAVLGLRFGGSAFTDIPAETVEIDGQPVPPAPSATTMILPQLAFGGGWYSALYFHMTGNATASFPVNFIGSGGAPLNVPALGGSSATVNLAPRGTAIVEIPNTGPETQGYASVTLPPGVIGYAVFRQTVAGRPDQEAVVPLSGSSATVSTLTWDETNFTTAVAAVGLSPNPGTILITARDASGSLLGTGTVSVPPNGKRALILHDVFGLGAMVGQRGSAEFSVVSGNVAVLGIRFGGAAFTDIPTSDR